MSCFVTRLHIQALTVIGIINIGNEACLHLTFGFTASSKAINILRAQPHASGIASCKIHHSDVIMGTMAFQINSLTTVFSIVYSGADQRKYQSSASLVLLHGIQRL